MRVVRSFCHTGRLPDLRNPIEPESGGQPLISSALANEGPRRRYDRKEFFVLREFRLFGVSLLRENSGLYVNGGRWLEKPVTTRN